MEGTQINTAASTSPEQKAPAAPVVTMTKEQFDALMGRIAGLEKKVAETTIVTTAAELPKIPAEAVLVGGKKYKWMLPVFSVNKKHNAFEKLSTDEMDVLPEENNIITAEEASTSPKLMELLLKIPGQGLLKEIV